MQHVSSSVKRMLGFRKIRDTCQLAHDQGLHHVWIDTCCIDKSSSAELSEAINSMFRWYSEAEVCYAYLQDVLAPAADDIRQSRWFLRGWTLQELIAPLKVEFYTKHWKPMGAKVDLRSKLSEITGIPCRVLAGASMDRIGAAQKMYWASKRSTTRVEDEAYSLMGLFDINMPLLYGEGRKAFYRLQEEILKRTQDHTLLAWHHIVLGRTLPLFATAPRNFMSSNNILPIFSEETPPLELTHRGVRMQLPTRLVNGCTQVALNCQLSSSPDGFSRCWLLLWPAELLRSDSEITREGGLLWTPKAEVEECANSKETLFVKPFPRYAFSRAVSANDQPVYQFCIRLHLATYRFMSDGHFGAWDFDETDPSPHDFWISTLLRADVGPLEQDEHVPSDNTGFRVLGGLMFRSTTADSDRMAVLVGISTWGGRAQNPRLALTYLGIGGLSALSRDELPWHMIRSPTSRLKIDKGGRVQAEFKFEAGERPSCYECIINIHEKS